VLQTECNVVATQLILIKTWEQVIQEAVNDADEYMGLIEKYCRLKEQYDGFLGPFFISDDDRYTMYMLKNKLGGDFDVNAKHVIWDLTIQLKQTLFKVIQPLKTSLYEWNIDEMKRQQTQFNSGSAKASVEKNVNRWKDKLIRLQSAVGTSTWNSLIKFVNRFLEKVFDKAVPLIANKPQRLLLT